MSERKQPENDDEDEDGRRRTNILMLVIGAVVVLVGIWLVNTMADMRKIQDCESAGRRNCVPIKVPGGRQTW
jgi:hypothetical protein